MVEQTAHPVSRRQSPSETTDHSPLQGLLSSDSRPPLIPSFKVTSTYCAALEFKPLTLGTLENIQDLAEAGSVGTGALCVWKGWPCLRCGWTCDL